MKKNIVIRVLALSIQSFASQPAKNWLLGQTRQYKRIILATNDFAIWIFSLWAAIALRLGDFAYIPPPKLWIMFAIAPAVGIAAFYYSNLYRLVTRYIGSAGFLRLLLAGSLTVLIWSLVYQMAGLTGMPRSSIVMWWVLSFLLLWSSRQLAAWFLLGSGAKRHLGKNVIIYGAGETGSMLAANLAHSNELNPIAFVDDHHSLHDQEMMGLKVFDSTHIGTLVRDFDVQELLLAIPSASQRERRKIISQIENLRIAVRTVPGAMELAEGRVEISDLRPVRIEDLLGRAPVPPVSELMDMNLRDKNIFITGAGGSIGSELCRQIIQYGARRLVMLDTSESALYSISEELNELTASDAPSERPALLAVLGSVLHENLIDSIFDDYEIDTVFHAAAYKHVPLVEQNAATGLKNNVVGTYCVAEAAARYGVGSFVLISTDKAVRPTNIMGASKRLSELVVQALGARYSPQTVFSCVRFGNVLGSSGSVVPKFREQIEKGGPVTVTHTEITRYFMSIPEAAQLVIQAGAMPHGDSQIYVLDMGQPVKIDDLARSMIRLMGRDVRDESNPDGDIEISYTGLRSGEKLHEELLIGGMPEGTIHPRILHVDAAFPNLSDLRGELTKLEHAITTNNIAAILTVLRENVEGFVSQLDTQELSGDEAAFRQTAAASRVPPLNVVI